ncbi:hypothetical protein L2E82_36168 [Cichorium intybus]|uniref:Uncharacterized protein n=1 Tax=Cichorium intybus TaxID=13427 RepID=A0ACB9BQX7_CICIN|nr:hypothetical protein L2E82_36168 [Cichorium intybus]
MRNFSKFGKATLEAHCIIKILFLGLQGIRHIEVKYASNSKKQERLVETEISEFNESREKELPHIQEVEIKIKELRQAISALNNHQISPKATIMKKKDAVKETARIV